jgi:hypothetical protein
MAMTRNWTWLAVIAALLALATITAPRSAGAIEVKKKLYSGGGGGGASGPAPKNPLTPALQQKLIDVVSDESYKFVSAESEKKSDGEVYIDLEAAKMKYLPSVAGDKTNVTCKLEAAEYRAKKGTISKGSATGKRKVLVFKYQLDGQKWVEQGEPAWEDVKSDETKTAKGK